MTGPANDVPNSRHEIPAEHVELMQQIQRLALRSGQLMQRMYESGGDALTATGVITRINALDRERDLTEIKARAAGVPAEWIDRVRTLGQRGFEWREDQPLPDPAPQGRRRTVQRVADDIERLKDMAAVHTAYQHTRGPGDTESGMETVVAQQLNRNMEAVWMRAGRAAHAIGMDAGERAALWSVTSAEWHRRVDHYLGGRDIADCTRAGANTATSPSRPRRVSLWPRCAAPDSTAPTCRYPTCRCHRLGCSSRPARRSLPSLHRRVLTVIRSRRPSTPRCRTEHQRRGMKTPHPCPELTRTALPPVSIAKSIHDRARRIALSCNNCERRR
ncbi:hypothetical protein [Nocardia sp. NPDC006630]|uniref:hypothetical protein n=1 Tax=Nocardia sp. NPDC006630 TaxID=3157181 RepID=UPI0033A0D3F5